MLSGTKFFTRHLRTAFLRFPNNGTKMDAFRRAIDAKYELHRHAFATCNLNLLLESFFHKDAVWAGPFPTSDTVVQGREALQEFFSHVIDHQIILPIRSYHCYVDGNVGWDYIIYDTIPREGYQGPEVSVAHSFRPVMLWVKEGDDWLVRGVLSYMKEPCT